MIEVIVDRIVMGGCSWYVLVLARGVWEMDHKTVRDCSLEGSLKLEKVIVCCVGEQGWRVKEEKEEEEKVGCWLLNRYDDSRRR